MCAFTLPPRPLPAPLITLHPPLRPPPPSPRRASGNGGAKDIAEARERKAEVGGLIKENERELVRYKEDIKANEADRKEIQAKIDTLASSNQNAAFLNLMSTFRLQVGRVGRGWGGVGV